jgi:tRNA A-37 threonylcarbamoyl transferase component Bud32
MRMSAIKDRKASPSDCLSHTKKVAARAERIRGLDAKSAEGSEALCDLLEKRDPLFVKSGPKNDKIQPIYALRSHVVALRAAVRKSRASLPSSDALIRPRILCNQVLEETKRWLEADTKASFQFKKLEERYPDAATRGVELVRRWKLNDGQTLLVTKNKEVLAVIPRPKTLLSKNAETQIVESESKNVIKKKVLYDKKNPLIREEQFYVERALHEQTIGRQFTSDPKLSQIAIPYCSAKAMIYENQAGRFKIAYQMHRATYDFEALLKHQVLQPAEREAFAGKTATHLLTIIATLHDAGFAHRDLKPANLFFSKGRMLLGDFETVVKGDTVGRSEKTTYSYCPPEVFKRKYVPQKVDMFGLGMILFESYFGKHPWWSGQSSEEAREKAMAFTLPAALSNLSPSQKEGILGLLAGLLDPVPETRYSITEALKHPWVQKLRKVPTPPQDAKKS